MPHKDPIERKKYHHSYHIKHRDKILQYKENYRKEN